MALTGRRFVIIVFAVFFAVMGAFSLIIELLTKSPFYLQLAEALFSGIAFLFLFVAIARHYLSPAPESFWAKFVALALGMSFLYVVLAVVVGEPLLSLMGLETSPLPLNSLLTVSEYRTLTLYSYGVSSISNGLTSLAMVYFIQKYMIRYLYYGYKLVTKYQNYFESDAPKPKLPIWICTLWLILLPFPIQQALSPNTIGGVNIVGTAFYLPSVLALFVLWGLGVTSLVGITKSKVFRLYETVNGALLGLLVIQWISFFVYSAARALVFQDAISGIVLLLIRSIFTFGPQALITGYLYKKILEKRTQAKIVEYIRQKENINSAKVTVQVE